MRKLPSQEFLRTIFRYDPRTGTLKRSTGSKCGRRKVSISNVDYWTPRVVWKMQTGEDPAGVIDFVDGDPSNLRWTNLVHRSLTEVRTSGRAHATSTTGARGVYPAERGGYRAEIWWGGKKHRLGTFRTVKAAQVARRRARVSLLRDGQA